MGRCPWRRLVCELAITKTPAYLLNQKDNVGISVLLAWDPDTRIPALWAYLIAGVYIRSPEPGGNP